jgi:hypothetical protein
MSRWGKPTKNKRRIDPRYHLSESAEREEVNELFGMFGKKKQPQQSDVSQSDEETFQKMQVELERGVRSLAYRGVPKPSLKWVRGIRDQAMKESTPKGIQDQIDEWNSALQTYTDEAIQSMGGKNNILNRIMIYKLVKQTRFPQIK